MERASRRGAGRHATRPPSPRRTARRSSCGRCWAWATTARGSLPQGGRATSTATPRRLPSTYPSGLLCTSASTGDARVGLLRAVLQGADPFANDFDIQGGGGVLRRRQREDAYLLGGWRPSSAATNAARSAWGRGEGGRREDDHDATTRARPRSLPSTTTKLQTEMGACTSRSPTDEDGEPFEVFGWLGKGGSFQHGVTELACRLISLHLRRGTPSGGGDRPDTGHPGDGALLEPAWRRQERPRCTDWATASPTSSRST